MAKKLKIRFEGLIAFAPKGRFDSAPRWVDVIIRDLRKPNLFTPSGVGPMKPEIIEPHHAWVQIASSFRFQDRRPSVRVPDFVQVENNKEGRSSALKMRQNRLRLKLNGRSPSRGSVVIHGSLLRHLPVYSGRLKHQYRHTSTPGAELASCLRLQGGTLKVVEKTQYKYWITRYNQQRVRAQVATALEWSTSFSAKAELWLDYNREIRKLQFRLRPLQQELLIRVRNRELRDLVFGARPAMGGADDPEYSIYGESIVGGVPQPLKSATAAIPGGRKPCGAAGVQG